MRARARPGAGVPPRATSFRVADLRAFDDEALRTFVGEGAGGVDIAMLGAALSSSRHEALVRRLAGLIDPKSAATLERARRRPRSARAIEGAEREVVVQLFWPLLYWHDPHAYQELIAGEEIDPAILEALPLDGRLVADLGAGAGRFTLLAAARARRVIAVDAVPALLERLAAAVHGAGISNVEIRRGSFLRLPLQDREVDVAVACSSLTSRPPAGGEKALASAERAVRRGGTLAVIWPDSPTWFAERGFRVVRARPPFSRRFADAAAAERVCRDFYGPDAVAWVRAHRTATVPYAVLGIPPPRALCLKTVE